ncbi:MAG: hypothetical protein NTX92_08695 [Euryarchaeota archaeon]|nr:hypothetical protein [Euryarchaeota archaeon]
MKKVLIIANLFHASPRIQGIAKYLPEFGWEPIILTVPIGDNPDVRPTCRYIEVPYKNMTKAKYERRSKMVKNNLKTGALKDFLYRQYQAIFCYPDAEKNWREPAIKKANDLFKNEKIEAILSSSSPVTCHLIANELKVKYKIPWIADLRDLWTQNHNYRYGPIRKFIERHLEIKTLSMADDLVTIAWPETERLKLLHKRATISTITNGFDPENINKDDAKLTTKFTITHTGVIYPGMQDLSKFFNALHDLITDKTIPPDDIEVRFYGTDPRFLLSEVNEYGLASIIKIFEKVPRQTSLEKQRESQILLLPTWGGKQMTGHGLKLFEYLAAQRPILAIGLGNDTKREVLQEIGAGVYAKTPEDIKKVLNCFYTEYKQVGYVPYTGDTKKINRYSHREMARNYVKILNNMPHENNLKLKNIIGNFKN